MQANPVVIGVDGGGTSTRALCATLDGRVLARAEAGGSNPSHNHDTEGNVQTAIKLVLQHADRSPGDVVASRSASASQ